jgi:hypothetical protein
MLPGDAYLWSKYRDDEELLNKFKEFTDKKFDTQRGHYGQIGDRTVIKNCGIIKDVKIGSRCPVLMPLCLHQVKFIIQPKAAVNLFAGISKGRTGS